VEQTLFTIIETRLFSSGQKNMPVIAGTIINSLTGHTSRSNRLPFQNAMRSQDYSPRHWMVGCNASRAYNLDFPPLRDYIFIVLLGNMLEGSLLYPQIHNKRVINGRTRRPRLRMPQRCTGHDGRRSDIDIPFSFDSLKNPAATGPARCIQAKSTEKDHAAFSAEGVVQNSRAILRPCNFRAYREMI